MTLGKELEIGREILLASNNQGKIREFTEMLTPLGYRVRAQGDLQVEEAEEPHATFVENALAKARHAARATGLACLADDSGICANALGGLPGVYSARFAGEPKSDQRNNAKLIEALAQHDDHSAYYYCVLVLLRHADDPQPLIVEGRWEGEIIATPRGQGGFGYDPYFYLPELGKTVAELAPAEKNRWSHRGQAMRMLIERLQ